MEDRATGRCCVGVRGAVGCDDEGDSPRAGRNAEKPVDPEAATSVAITEKTWRKRECKYLR